ncbi:glycosyltransferase, partial [Candidatus Aminicenantes bacterium AC-335-L06]|nr:glycosyltransferase [Candidatus Aminicenantes bacterium AC-335-L06]
KAGLLYADVLTTGSKRHIEEIEGGEFDFGLKEILRKRKDSFFGIINGIDYEVWNPEHDRHIEANYSKDDLEPKKICKEDLIKEFNLKIKKDDFLIGIVSYLTIYKGFELLFEIIDELVKMDIGIVALVKGDDELERNFMKMHRKYPEKIGVKLAIDTTLSHKVIAGSDILLIPSKYEPCGLNQFYGFRYGTVPVVRATGGLDETVEEFNPEKLTGSGFKFREFKSRELFNVIKRALDYYRKPDIWTRIMINGMEKDFSWKNSAREYLRIYQLALKRKEVKNGN